MTFIVEDMPTFFCLTRYINNKFIQIVTYPLASVDKKNMHSLFSVELILIAIQGKGRTRGLNTSLVTDIPIPSSTISRDLAKTHPSCLSFGQGISSFSTGKDFYEESSILTFWG